MKPLAWLVKHEKTVLWSAIGLYIAVFSGICLWKYGLFAYDGLDLAIYNNVLWNTVHGRPFAMSIHPHAYLGDHAEFGLLALVPFYALFQDPRTLLILQTVALALAAWPVYLIAKGHEGARRGTKEPEVLCAPPFPSVPLRAPLGPPALAPRGENTSRRLLPLVMALAWLLNPLVHNMNLFEFHFLPFALVPLFFMLLAYEKGQRWRFVLFAALAMLVREDVTFVVAAVSILALFEKKSWWWRTIPLLIGAAWFLAATRIIAHFAPGDGYKFLIYYSWLGDSFGSMAINAVLHPLKVAAHVFQPRNFEMLIGFGLPLIMLPYLAPRRLVLAAGPFLQIVLGAAGGGALILQTHYSTLFLPGIFLATIAVIERAQGCKGARGQGTPAPLLPCSPAPYAGIALGLMLFSSVYGALVLGPLPYAVARMASGDGRDEARDATIIVKAVPKDMPVVASYRLLPQLSSREQVFSAHYVFLGVEQFDTGTYSLPPDTNALLAFDSRDLATYRAQFLATEWAKPHYEGGRERLAALVGPKRAAAGFFALYGQPWTSFAAPPLFAAPPQSLEEPLLFSDRTAILGWQAEANNGRLKIQFQTILGDAPNESKRLTFTLDDGQGHAFEFEIPLVNELQQNTEAGARYSFETDISFPLSAFRFPLSAPRLPTGTYALTVALDTRDETHILDGIRTTTRMTLNKTDLGQHQVGSIEIK